LNYCDRCGRYDLASHIYGFEDIHSYNLCRFCAVEWEKLIRKKAFWRRTLQKHDRSWRLKADKLLVEFVKRTKEKVVFT
jgi:hypothetical protein